MKKIGDLYKMPMKYTGYEMYLLNRVLRPKSYFVLLP